MGLELEAEAGGEGLARLGGGGFGDQLRLDMLGPHGRGAPGNGGGREERGREQEAGEGIAESLGHQNRSGLKPL